MQRHVAAVVLAAGVWRSLPLWLGRTWAERWRGLRPRPDGGGLLLETRSVHTFGMREPLWVASLDACGRVLRVRLLPPGRAFLDLDARWVLELPASAEPPCPGMVTTVVTKRLAVGKRHLAPGSP